MALMLLAMAAGAGCGGSGAEAGGAPAIGKAEFVAKATRICKQNRKRFLTAALRAEQRAHLRTAADRARFEAENVERRLAPRLDTEIREIRALGAPSGDEGKVEAILSALQEVADFAAEDPKGFYEAQFKFHHPYRKVFKLADEYGIPACGNA